MSSAPQVRLRPPLPEDLRRAPGRFAKRVPTVERIHIQDGRLLTETNQAGILGGMTVTHTYDGLHRRTGYSAAMAGSSHAVTFDYDPASRLDFVGSGDDEATYTRVANAPLLSGLSRAHDSNPVVATSWQHDFHNRLESVSSSTGAGPVSAHEYTYDALGRRVAAEMGDGSRWDYGYDSDGQVLSASRKQISDESPVPGQQFAYAYDGIGNRSVAEVNGRTSVLTSNTLNQYTQRTVPGAIDVRGRALASAGVVVNDGIATRQGDSFHRAVPVDNSTGPQHPEVRVQALGAGAGPDGADLKAEEVGRVYVPGTPEVYTYDFDGNLTGDGRWIYTWDSENRLIAMESIAAAPASAKRKLEFLYDSEGRRIRKRVHDWNGTAYVLSSERRYLYDGWNLMAELVASPTPFVRTYVWGLDLSGSEQGAGGVGGLLAIQEDGESHYPVYDGNGNVMALVRGSDGGISGRYHYGAFGEVLEVEETGISNPFRFSTKFEDSETGLLYYGYRYYSPETGRWLNRDPIEERGGVNLYGFVGNDGVGSIDILGREPRPTDQAGIQAAQNALNKFLENPSGAPEYCGLICCNSKTGEMKRTGPFPGKWVNESRGHASCSPFGPDGRGCDALVDGDYIAVASYHNHPSPSGPSMGHDGSDSHFADFHGIPNYVASLPASDGVSRVDPDSSFDPSKHFGNGNGGGGGGSHFNPQGEEINDIAPASGKEVPCPCQIKK